MIRKIRRNEKILFYIKKNIKIVLYLFKLHCIDIIDGNVRVYIYKLLKG